MIKKLFVGLLYVVGAYAALAVAWVTITTIGAALGFETARGKEQRELLRAFNEGHRQLFCKKSGIPPSSVRCIQEYNKSDYKKSVAVELARVKSAKDVEDAKKLPRWRRMVAALMRPFQ